MHFDSTGTIPFASSGTSATWTANNSGLPTVGMVLSSAGSASRTYSFVAAVSNSGSASSSINNLRIEIILRMIKQLLSKLGVTGSFSYNGITY